MDTIYDAKLLIVDDNAELLALLCEQLRGAGYGHIRTAQSCAAARICFAAEQPELMILDINLPDGDGFSLFRALRAKADVPALFLSARDADADRLFGLGLGADDYLTKPFLMQELLLRVQHILQRAYRAELSRTKPVPLQLGERCVDLNDAIVTLPEGKTLALTATELALLRKLAENRGPSLPTMPFVRRSGAQITMAMRTVWGYISGICGRSWKPNPVCRSFCGRCGASAIS